MINIFGSDEEENEERENNIAAEDEGILEEEKQEKDEKSLFGRLKDGLKKSREGFVNKVGGIFSGRSKIDDELYEELEETLIKSDVGVQTTMDLISELKEYQKEEKIEEPEELFEIFKEEIREILSGEDQILHSWEGLKVLMVVGVNGSGKTTTIAKLANRFQNKGKDVLMAAGDTFRAGAIEQIETWGQRLGIDVIAQEEGADAAAVAYDAVQAARARDTDLLIVDTAGRLHTQKILMQELEKVRRVIGREAGEENVEVLLVLDATTGQNALHQAEKFDEAVDVDGIALTKLDGTASGGIVVAVRNELGIPIRLIGVGEQAADLQDFDPDSFVEALFSE